MAEIIPTTQATGEQVIDGGDASDFIDERDSWALENLASLDDMTLGQLRTAYAAAGLEMEVRVWKSS